MILWHHLYTLIGIINVLQGYTKFIKKIAKTLIRIRFPKQLSYNVPWHDKVQSRHFRILKIIFPVAPKLSLPDIENNLPSSLPDTCWTFHVQAHRHNPAIQDRRKFVEGGNFWSWKRKLWVPTCLINSNTLVCKEEF